MDKNELLELLCLIESRQSQPKVKILLHKTRLLSYGNVCVCVCTHR